MYDMAYIKKPLEPLLNFIFKQGEQKILVFAILY